MEISKNLTIGGLHFLYFLFLILHNSEELKVRLSLFGIVMFRPRVPFKKFNSLFLLM